ncbi:MAG: flagellar hook-basal body complex protein FliE [Gammaproteobacteria bacterium]|nr:flagellar hook-basal body complex protein FliE [Gammaproteobacteria bacterium]MDH4313258.1 flagellar hook-basal body complex protein FliE [Gammaproteobacteria bacterium]MDH5212941.1 flagellar hook-basal body complex protein FliE [Gammaproteobacteria bacterium]MDH5500495.1 flagellar hook-basal body complex protein FliE [Gammaproteobacteria bacterium]
MNEINTSQLLSQIRTLGAGLQAQVPTPVADTSASSFGSLLKNSIAAVNETQQASRELKIAFEHNSSDTSLAEVMIASQKADLSFRAMTEVRNKLVNAYEEIMNMPV